MSNTGIKTSGTLYLDLAERLRHSIRSGRYGPGELIGSEHGLARTEQISRVTVRKASDLLVDEGIVERRPGKGLFVRDRKATWPSRTIQVIAGNLEWEPAIQISRGVQAVASQQGTRVILHDAHGNFETDVAMVESLADSDVAGAVITSLHNPRFNEAVFGLKRAGFPFVLVDQTLRDIEVPSVIADNHGGGYQVGRMLTERGHRRIAFIGDLVADTVQDRLAGLRDAVADAGLAFDRSMTLDLHTEADRLGDWSAPVVQATGKLMNRSTPPTAIFCACDAIARLAYRHLKAMGIRVPQQVSIVGFDDDPIAEWLSPRLTTVRQPFRQMGHAAMDLLNAQMAKPTAAIEQRTLPVELVDRESVAPPAAAGCKHRPRIQGNQHE